MSDWDFFLQEGEIFLREQSNLNFSNIYTTLFYKRQPWNEEKRVVGFKKIKNILRKKVLEGEEEKEGGSEPSSSLHPI